MTNTPRPRPATDTTSADPRIDALGHSAILTDTVLRLTFAPARPEARVVALRQEVRKDKIDQVAALTQQGVVHLQVKAGFGSERHLTLSPAEAVILFQMLDAFIHELPRVDTTPV